MASLVLLHTCESEGTAASNAAYLRAMKTEPHWVFDPRFPLDEAIQMLPYSAAAKALRNLPGGVETNRLDVDRDGQVDVIQVELVGYASRVAGYDDAWYRTLREFLTRLCAEVGVPYRFPYRFAQDYSDARRVRLSDDQWMDPALTGIVGHCHAPESDHWDPGPLDLRRLAPEAQHPTETSEEDDMELRIHEAKPRPGTSDTVDFPYLPTHGSRWGRQECACSIVIDMETELPPTQVRVFMPRTAPVTYDLAWGAQLILPVVAADGRGGGKVSVEGVGISVHAREAWAAQ